MELQRTDNILTADYVSVTFEAQKNGHTVTIYENKELYNLISKFDAVVPSKKLSEKEIEKTNPRSFEAQKRETAYLTFNTNK